MAKYSNREVRRLVLGSVIAFLRSESQVDIDDQGYIDRAVIEQERLAVRLEREMRNI